MIPFGRNIQKSVRLLFYHLFVFQIGLLL